VVMAVVVWLIMGDSASWLARSTLGQAAWLAALLAIGIAVYLLMLAVMGIRPHHLRPAVGAAGKSPV